MLLYRRALAVEVLLAHMGGPYFAGRDDGAWTIPKGEYAPDEDPLTAARREFAEELGVPPPDGPLLELGEVRQSGGKSVAVWAVEGEFDPATAVSDTFELEWPPHSGRMRTFPEVDRVAWFGLGTARVKVVAAQAALLDRLAEATA